MDDLTSGYAAVKDRIAELVVNSDRELLARQVPACPDWSVRDLVSHMVGLIDSRLNATVPDGLYAAWSPDPEKAASGHAILNTWTSAMVDARNGQSGGPATRLQFVSCELQSLLANSLCRAQTLNE